MARPEEKAQAMMNKWVQMREDGNAPHHKKRRPFLASDCEHLGEAERWRREIIKEISDGIQKIQNPGLGEHAIRDLNDLINKRMREKYHWNRRIHELGGPNFNAIERRTREAEGDIQSIKGSGGYRYFGAAKDLPGVKELFARTAKLHAKRKREVVFRNVNTDYYGLRYEEDGVLLDLEAEATKNNLERLEQERKKFRIEREKNGQAIEDESADEDDVEDDLQIAVPTQELVAQMLLERKKKELLERLS